MSHYGITEGVPTCHDLSDCGNTHTPSGSVLVGLGMLGRAELAFVVIDIAYVQNRILSDDAFYTLMFTAFWLNVGLPILIRWWKPYYVAELARE